MTPILPMRHGNWVSQQTIKSRSCSLRSYLWGMETHEAERWLKSLKIHSDPTYEAWKHITILLFCSIKNNTPILPMRHGNFLYPWNKTWATVPTPILPMRHGNEAIKKGERLAVSNSDPTYEAWKPASDFTGAQITLTPILPMRHGNREFRLSYDT